MVASPGSGQKGTEGGGEEGMQDSLTFTPVVLFGSFKERTGSGVGLETSPSAPCLTLEGEDEAIVMSYTRSRSPSQELEETTMWERSRKANETSWRKS